MRRFGGVLLAVALMGTVAATLIAAEEKVRVLRLGHNGSTGSLYQITAERYAEIVNEKLKGRVEIQVIPGAKLGSDEQVIKGIKIGAPEMALVSTIMSAVEPKFGVFEMPYLITSRAQMKRVAENARIKSALFASLPAEGMRVLGVWDNGFRQMTNNVRPITGPEDLEALRLRVPSGAWKVKVFKGYGAVPTPTPLGDTYAALKSGAMDGQENPLSQIASNKFQEVQKYLSLTEHAYSPAFLVISDEVWKKLPGDVQDTLEKIAGELAEFSRREGERLDRDLARTLAPPMQLNTVDKERFVKASTAIYDEFGKQVPGGGDLINMIRALR